MQLTNVTRTDISNGSGCSSVGRDKKIKAPAANTYQPEMASQMSLCDGGELEDMYEDVTATCGNVDTIEEVYEEFMDPVTVTKEPFRRAPSVKKTTNKKAAKKKPAALPLPKNVYCNV